MKVDMRFATQKERLLFKTAAKSKRKDDPILKNGLAQVKKIIIERKRITRLKATMVCGGNASLKGRMRKDVEQVFNKMMKKI